MHSAISGKGWFTIVTFGSLNKCTNPVALFAWTPGSLWSHIRPKCVTEARYVSTASLCWWIVLNCVIHCVDIPCCAPLSFFTDNLVSVIRTADRQGLTFLFIILFTIYFSSYIYGIISFSILSSSTLKTLSLHPCSPGHWALQLLPAAQPWSRLAQIILGVRTTWHILVLRVALYLASHLLLISNSWGIGNTHRVGYA